MKRGADFQPFRAYRYHPQKNAIGDVIAPPYDVISKDEQRKLYERSPYNCIRLILNQEEAADNDQVNRYTRARDFYEQWKKEGILIQEEKPAFYLYRQVFEHPLTGLPLERTAILGRLRLEPFENQIVIPHEKTLSKPRADRRKLLEMTHANFSPIFGLYEHPHEQHEEIQSRILSKPALYEAMDDQGVRHSVWPIQDTEICRGISQAIQQQKIYIADGHHRYQTALEYGLARRKELGVPQDQPLDSDYVYIALVEFHDPGLVLLPTHRMIQKFPGFSEEQMVTALKGAFDVQAMSLEDIQRTLNHRSSQKRPIQLGLYLKNQESFLLTLRDAAGLRKKMPQDKSELWCQLDVAMISHLILAQLWHLPEDQWETMIRYTHSTEEAILQIKNRQSAAAFLLSAPSVELLRDMGKTGELLPQKSTYFYPKLASGLLFHHHEK